MINRQSSHTLFIGCSGGQGHNNAIKQLLDKHKAENPNIELIEHKSAAYKNNQTPLWHLLNSGIKIQHASFLSPLIKRGMALTSFPILPTQEEMNQEIAQLNENQTTTKFKPYIDMLLDIYPLGFEYAAIWNILQRTEKTDDLKKLVKLQQTGEAQIYDIVKKYFYNLLIDAKNKNAPYEEIVSTQALSLRALCDAVIQYNTETELALNIKINQYMTDTVTNGAIHFLNILSSLTAKQRQHMVIHGVNLNAYINSKDGQSLTNPPFAGLCNISPDNNPMVRKGFYSKHESTEKYVRVQTKVNGFESPVSEIINIDPICKVAMIMLGSQTGMDTINYVKSLSTQCDVIFVFGGLKPEIHAQIIDLNNSMKAKIIPIGNQDDKHVAQIMWRSNIIVVRGGGLTVMELMALFSNYDAKNNPFKIIFIHNKQNSDDELTSGISWEDENGEILISYLSNKGIIVLKTTHEQLALELDTVGKNGNDLSLSQLSRFAIELQSILNKIPAPSSPHLNLSSFNTYTNHKVAIEKLLVVLNSIIQSTDDSPQLVTFNAEEIKALKTSEHVRSLVIKHLRIAEKDSIDDVALYLTALQSKIKAMIIQKPR